MMMLGPVAVHSVEVGQERFQSRCRRTGLRSNRGCSRIPLSRPWLENEL